MALKESLEAKANVAGLPDTGPVITDIKYVDIGNDEFQIQVKAFD